MDPAWEWLSAKGQLFIWQIRLPRTLAVVLVGAALALSGAIMQALFEKSAGGAGSAGRLQRGGRRADCRVLLGKGVLPGWALGLCAILGALAESPLFCCVFAAAISLPAVCCWRGLALGDHLQRPDDLGGLLLHLF
ncbi:Vitamin B12 ABC transporter [Klebsiella variicola]|uniref:Vitamin B12 ABC transporter n=1 Tax=Klebsiella variicola TaxID=244366 RepID=A0A7H4MM94_KLEVA|nr:Vitamin B12 ABC transporter [Klebsiella variicola]